MSDLGPLEWRAWPWRSRGRAPQVLAAAALVALLGSALSQGSGLLVGLTVASAVYVLAPLFIPVRYRLDADGVSRASPFTARRFPWSAFTGYRADPAGRTLFLRLATPRWRKLPAGIALFLPDEKVAREARRRLEAWLPAGTPRPEEVRP